MTNLKKSNPLLWLWLLPALLLLSYALFRFFTDEAERDVKVLRLAHVLNEKHPVHQGMEHFAKEVSRLSAGRLRVDLYADGQLGSERELLESLQMGSLAMTKVSTGQLETFSPKIGVFSLPYLFDDSAHFWRVAESAVGQELLDASLAYRIKGLTYFDAGSRSFYLSKKMPNAILTPDDLNNRVIRVMSSKTAVRMVELLGAKPVPIPFGELYSALDTGTVEGAENNAPSLYSSKQYEVASSYSLNAHAMVPDVLVIGTPTWNGLSKQEQQWLKQAAEAASLEQRKLWQAAEVEALSEMRKAGLNIVTDINREAFRQRMAPLYADKNLVTSEVDSYVKRIQSQGGSQ